MEKKVVFTPQSILKKKFTRDVKGYDAYEVDAFLDQVILDYQSYEEALAEAEDEVAKAKREAGEFLLQKEELTAALSKVREERHGLEVKNASLENRLDGIKPGDSVNSENLQLLKRLRTLEEFLYRHGYSPSEITSGLKK